VVPAPLFPHPQCENYTERCSNSTARCKLASVNSNKTVTDELEADQEPPGEFPPDATVEASSGDIHWLSTQAAARRLGITPRTLYRFIDHGDLPAYRFGRVIRLKAHEVDAFIESSRIKPGELEHLYPEPVGRDDED
jgi:excisionase family DNA binding protein